VRSPNWRLASCSLNAFSGPYSSPALRPKVAIVSAIASAPE
jgi:hypothetical protein